MRRLRLGDVERVTWVGREFCKRLGFESFVGWIVLGSLKLFVNLILAWK